MCLTSPPQKLRDECYLLKILVYGWPNGSHDSQAPPKVLK